MILGCLILADSWGDEPVGDPVVRKKSFSYSEILAQREAEKQKAIFDNPPLAPVDEWAQIEAVEKAKDKASEDFATNPLVVTPEAVKDPLLDKDDLQSIKDDLNGKNIGNPLLEKIFEKRVTEEDFEEAQREGSGISNNSSELFKANDIQLKTELNQKEIIAIAKLNLVSKKYSIGLIDDFLNTYMGLKVSHKRQGRREFIQGLHAEERANTGEQTAMGRFLGKFGGGGQ